jgi:hypothetical protein
VIEVNCSSSESAPGSRTEKGLSKASVAVLVDQSGVRIRVRIAYFNRRTSLFFNAVPALAQYHQVNLTGYQPGTGRFLDPKLNGWGMVSLADGSFCDG